jgi:thiol-disulfide isomerase/thioredoxin
MRVALNRKTFALPQLVLDAPFSYRSFRRPFQFNFPQVWSMQGEFGRRLCKSRARCLSLGFLFACDSHFISFSFSLKVIAPKFDEFSEKYPDAVFLKVRLSLCTSADSLNSQSRGAESWANLYFVCFQVIGDASPDASKLMKREGVRSVPSFHYFMKGEKVDVVNGANAEAIEAAITKHIK